VTGQAVTQQVVSHDVGLLIAMLRYCIGRIVTVPIRWKEQVKLLSCLNMLSHAVTLIWIPWTHEMNSINDRGVLSVVWIRRMGEQGVIGPWMNDAYCAESKRVIIDWSGEKR
jgi:hypothetical protein